MGVDWFAGLGSHPGIGRDLIYIVIIWQHPF